MQIKFVTAKWPLIDIWGYFIGKGWMRVGEKIGEMFMVVGYFATHISITSFRTK
jgi:hypothetical protein